MLEGNVFTQNFSLSL